MEIRVLTPLDGARLYALWLRGAGDHPAAFGSTADEFERLPASDFTQQNLTKPDRFVVLGVVLDHELVGFVAIGRDLRAKLRHIATLGPIYVIPELRGRGLGVALVDAALAYLKELPGVAYLKLTVAVGNTAARQLYRRCGFVPYGVEPNGMRIADQLVDMELLARPVGSLA
jgi:ribosomal protein S18 acetylase RimI-like enzyme